MNFDDWYKDISKKHGLSQNPDDWQHFYDYRAAHKSGVKGPDELGHWPSEFKYDLHPNRFINQGDGTFLDSKNNTYVTKSIVDETNIKRLIYKMLKGLPDKIK